MRIFFLLSVIGCFAAHGQCLTDFSKLTPEPSPDYSLDFGQAISMYGEYLAVGLPNSDTVARQTGLVQIYKKQGTKWIKNASIVPPFALEGIQFGVSLEMSQDYLFVGALHSGGSVYVYKKNGADWVNPVRLAVWSVPGGARFGTNWNDPIAITADQNTVAITDVWHQDSSFPDGSTGAIYLYHKNAGDEWSHSSTRTLIPPPEMEVDDFGGNGVQFQGSRLATITRFAPTANGQIFVYKENSGSPGDFQLEAKLAVGDLNYSYGFGNNNFAFTEDGIFTMASVNIGTPNARWAVVFFEQPQTGAWTDSYLTCHFDPNASGEESYWAPNIFATDGKDLMITSRNANGKGFLTHLKKGAGGWCNPVYETMDENLPDPSTTQRYGLVLAANQNLDAVVGYVAHPSIGLTQVALKTFSQSAGIWKPDYVYRSTRSTAAHYYGNKILGTGDNLFVSAPYDGTVKSNAGAVYIYEKNGSDWTKAGKILPPAGNQYDDVFGSSIATNGDYLVVAASHSPGGKFFVYKKGSDWSDYQFVQAINLVADGLVVYTSGDHVAMSDEWLVIPYMDSGSSNSLEECHIFLAFYKFNGSSFQLHQSTCIQNSNFFARSSTVPVSIEGNLIVAGAKILELNQAGNWEYKYQLSNTNPEPIQFNPDFTIRTNGDRFGFANYISDGKIFISAPARDYNDTWDVGAVYVYSKLPGEEWSSRTESAIIVPNTKAESGLFGYSLAAMQNTLIVGSPQNDRNRYNQVTNIPGRASVFQAKDYHWTNTQWVADFSGDSFTKDYFGMAVHLDETDFFMGAPIEDLETGKLSGSVYIVPTPPMVKLVPPVCFADQSLELMGYPFLGTWSGPGITDPSRGIFNPTVAGPGLHTITYQTPNCANAGVLQIEVTGAPLTVITDGTDHIVCPNVNPISVYLQVEPEPSVSYQWYYREDSDGVFTSEGVISPALTATKRGEYQVKASNGNCISFSPTMRIYNEQVELTLQTLPTSCSTTDNSIALNATPIGGVWTGFGVSNNNFYPSNRPAGDYLVTYNYASELGCNYTKTTLAKVVDPYLPELLTTGDICFTGDVSVSLKNAAPDTVDVLWMMKEPTQTGFSIIQSEGNSVKVNVNGIVKAVTQTTYCSAEEASVIINDSFMANVLPFETTLEYCPDSERKLAVAGSTTGMSVTWKYYEEFMSDAVIVGNPGPELRPEKTGYYYASIELGSCFFETGPKRVVILPGDSLFVPNVFTPNGDGKNDVFRISTDNQSSSFEIFSRYGKSVFSDPNNIGWNGGDSPGGVYFWHAVTPNCRGDLRTRKGSVLLIR
jgi:gliding motility-associated-like protein